MTVTWTPSLLDLTPVEKPDATIFNISATSNAENIDSVVYIVDSDNLSSTSIITVDESGVHITGDSSGEFIDLYPILYLQAGTIESSTFDPDDLILGDVIYSWKPDSALNRTANITITVNFLNIGEDIIDTSTNIYSLVINNNWDEHVQAMNTIMGRLYP